MKKVSIIIPTYNRGPYIRQTIESFLSQDYPAFELIVCNNKSTDDTANVLKRFQSNPKVKLLFEERQGAHFARNSAAKQAVGEILYFTDDDMIATPNLLSELVTAFELDPKVGIATGRVLPQWMVPPPMWVVRHLSNSLLSLNNSSENLVISDRDCGVYSCHEAVLKDAFFATGGFRPDNIAGVWIGDGETGLNQMIISRGYKTAFIGTSVIYHVIPPQRMTQAYLNTRLRNQGNADAYTLVQTKNGRVYIGLEVVKSLFEYAIFGAKNMIKSLRDLHRLRFIVAMAYYHVAKVRYLLRVQSDADFKSMVMQRDWLKGNWHSNIT
jgi:glucosyl-dolichyl phosphate glucuronosyltransferase